MNQTPQAPLVDLSAYLARIGYDGPLAPTLEVLTALQAAHIAAIPFEAIDVLVGEGVDLDPTAIDAKLIGARRGGYCFEQNGLFLRVLDAIGFEVAGLIARVRWMLPDDAPPTPRTHQLTRVTIGGTAWLVDVGFGSAVPAAPLRLGALGAQPTAHEPCRVVDTGGGWRVEADIEGSWMTLYDVDPAPAAPIDYEVGNWYTSQHPASHFRHQLIAARTTADLRLALRNNRLTIRSRGAPAEQRYLGADEIEAVLASTFGLAVSPHWRRAIERAAVMEVAA
ncbi:arylamine N-acetyltransferase [Sphingopyxis sp. QXT-31]|uniref:arylamine N-acetyltransferase family protein n=1 Tax=Sphingopyxis sp. QXT-31 TaxID=1357916 RepID=UPI00097954E1|nr:arylamine N-acetyltransferase [Sphingopyxis sp. QXT-31]AQA00897.1 arylamine N-acetyltransferase [Sphingopyxis sp. QXT-31]